MQGSGYTPEFVQRRSKLSLKSFHFYYILLFVFFIFFFLKVLFRTLRYLTGKQISQAFCLFIYLFVYLGIRLCEYVSIISLFLFTYPFVHLFVYLSINLFIYLFIYLFICDIQNLSGYTAEQKADFAAACKTWIKRK